MFVCGFIPSICFIVDSYESIRSPSAHPQTKENNNYNESKKKRRNDIVILRKRVKQSLHNSLLHEGDKRFHARVSSVPPSPLEFV